MRNNTREFLKFFLLPFIGFILMASVVAMGVQVQFGIDQAVTVAMLTFGCFMYSIITHKAKRVKYTGFKMGVEVEMWANYIIERLWKDNGFLKLFFSDDDKVMAGKIVHIPNPGAKPNVVKNRNAFPATAIRRADADILYALDEYTTDPTHIQDAEKVELSYDKIDSVYGDHAGQLAETVAEDAIYKYLQDIPQENIVRTEGDATTEILDGATGNRKKMTVKLVRKMQTKANKANVSRLNRYALLSSQMYAELLDDLSVTQQRDFSLTADPANGILGKLYGWTFLERSTVAVAQEDGGVVSIKPVGSEVEAADHDVSFFWQQDCATRALGEVKFFENPDRAEYYGDVYSALLRFGGRRRRADNAGVYAVVQANG